MLKINGLIGCSVMINPQFYDDFDILTEHSKTFDKVGVVTGMTPEYKKVDPNEAIIVFYSGTTHKRSYSVPLKYIIFLPYREPDVWEDDN